MALTRSKIWIAGEILTHTDLNAEFDNFINNAASLISPWTSNIDAGGFRLTAVGTGSIGSPSLQFTADGDTGVWSSTANTVDISAAGVRAAQFGASFLLSAAPEDSRTNTVDVLGELRSTTSSTPAAGIGTGLLFSAESADENPSNVGELDFAFSDVTAASEDSYLDILLRVAGAALTSLFRFSGTGAFLATITHALTAARTFTLPNVTGTFVVTGVPTNGQIPIGSTATGQYTAATITAGTGVSISNGAGSITISGSGATSGQKDTVRKTTNFTTSSTTFVDVTDMSITFTTGANRVWLSMSGSVSSNLASSGIILTFDIDGTNVGGTNGLMQTVSPVASDQVSASFNFLSDVLSAASHTFKVRMRGDNGAQTYTLQGNPTAIFNAIEV